VIKSLNTVHNSYDWLKVHLLYTKFLLKKYELAYLPDEMKRANASLVVSRAIFVCSVKNANVKEMTWADSDFGM